MKGRLPSWTNMFPDGLQLDNFIQLKMLEYWAVQTLPGWSPGCWKGSIASIHRDRFLWSLHWVSLGGGFKDWIFDAIWRLHIFSNRVGSTTNYSNNDSWFVHFGFSMVHKNSLDLLGQLGNALDQLVFETTRRSKISMAFVIRGSQSLGFVFF